MDLVLLSRIQFAVTIGFHYLYPPLSIGLGMLLVMMEAAWLRTRNPLYHQLTRFWVRVFSLTFALGVATGIVMEFEFGTNWASYSRFVGDVFGSALAAEGIFAFFLESGFLALLVFGWNKIGPRLHFFSTLMVCLGAHFSAIWIIVADSWMQTPTGHEVVTDAAGTRAVITDFWAVVFNPSSMVRLAHTLMGCWQAGAFLVLSVSAWYLLKKRHRDFALASAKFALVLALVSGLGSAATGHVSGQVVARHQPTKLAAMEGLFETTPGAGLHLWGWVDEAAQSVRGGVQVPGLLSLLAHNDPAAPVTGLREFAPRDWPPVNPVFQAFHLMIWMGVLLLLLSVAGCWLWWRGRLADHRVLLRLLVWAVLGPQVANQAGWMTAEVGRQPWIVWGLMRTADGVSRAVHPEHVLISLILFTVVYVLLFGLFLFLLDQKIQHGPEDADLVPVFRRADA